MPYPAQYGVVVMGAFTHKKIKPGAYSRPLYTQVNFISFIGTSFELWHAQKEDQMALVMRIVFGRVEYYIF